MIDTHCHIYTDAFDEDLPAVLDRAADAGLTDIIMPSIDLNSRAAMQRMYHDRLRFHPVAGIHPCDVKGPTDEIALWKWAGEDDVVAVGESGLDYYWSSEHISEQKASFRFHCRMARELDKPLIIHNRESTHDMLQILREEQDGRLRGVWHCFNGSVEEGLQAIDTGFHLGIGGGGDLQKCGCGQDCVDAAAGLDAAGNRRSVPVAGTPSWKTQRACLHRAGCRQAECPLWENPR